jgi:CBS domain-containing protein
MRPGTTAGSTPRAGTIPPRDLRSEAIRVLMRGEALALTDRGGYRHVPLVDGQGRPLGVLRQQDILAYLAEAFPEEILNLPPRPHQRMPGAEGA